MNVLECEEEGRGCGEASARLWAAIGPLSLSRARVHPSVTHHVHGLFFDCTPAARIQIRSIFQTLGASHCVCVPKVFFLFAHLPFPKKWIFENETLGK